MWEVVEEAVLAILQWLGFIQSCKLMILEVSFLLTNFDSTSVIFNTYQTSVTKP